MRCLNCGVCCECMQCVSACEANAIDHAMRPEKIEVKVGSIILATGYDVMDPTPMQPYGYGRYPNVYTALEFERLSNATGPTGGKILIRDETGRIHPTTPKCGFVALHREPGCQLPRVLLAGLLYVCPEIYPSYQGKGGARYACVRLLYRHALLW